MAKTIMHGWMNRWMAAWGNVPAPGYADGREIGPQRAVASRTESSATAPTPDEATDGSQRESPRHSTRWTLAAFR